MRTDEKLAEICENLRTTHGDFHTSCRRAGVSTDFVAKWIKDDKEAAEQIEEAQRLGYMSLESAAIQRGVYGVEKAVYFKGEVVGYETQYSDSLLVKLMEANLPKYNKKESNNVFNGPTQINVMPRATSYEEWLEMKALEDQRSKTPALPSPTVKVPEILQGDYVEIPDEPAPTNPMACLEGIL